MRLLFDQNLSPRLVGALADQHDGSSHVRIRRDTCSTGEIVALLGKRHADLPAFEQDETASFLALG